MPPALLEWCSTQVGGPTDNHQRARPKLQHQGRSGGHLPHKTSRSWARRRAASTRSGAALLLTLPAPSSAPTPLRTPPPGPAGSCWQRERRDAVQRMPRKAGGCGSGGSLPPPAAAAAKSAHSALHYAPVLVVGLVVASQQRRDGRKRSPLRPGEGGPAQRQAAAAELPSSPSKHAGAGAAAGSRQATACGRSAQRHSGNESGGTSQSLSRQEVCLETDDRRRACMRHCRRDPILAAQRRRGRAGAQAKGWRVLDALPHSLACTSEGLFSQEGRAAKHALGAFNYNKDAVSTQQHRPPSRACASACITRWQAALRPCRPPGRQ